MTFAAGSGISAVSKDMQGYPRISGDGAVSLVTFAVGSGKSKDPGMSGGWSHPADGTGGA